MELSQVKEKQIFKEKRSYRKKYYIETYGCQMNVADSELIEAMLENEGYIVSNDPWKSDVIFINTCSIREKAEEKIHSQLGRWDLIKKQKPEILIGVLGCMAQNLKQDLLENRPFVDIVLGPDSYRNLPTLLKRKLKDRNSIVDTKLSRFEVYEGLFPNRRNGINAWISIMRGCDKFCTFCIVPFTRGRERSRSLDSILFEAKQAIKDGFREITLLGQNVNSYNYNQYKFHNLLERVAKIPGVDRIRYTSPHPQDITDDLLQVMSQYDNISNYIHLPLQSGNNRILKRMHRSYTQNDFLVLVEKIRENLPGVGISTDIIVGFPGETEEEFLDTIYVMEKVKFDSAFTFKYSPRLGTKAYEYDDQISENIKKCRLEKIIKLQKEHSLIRNSKLLGTIQTILVEKESKMSKKQWAGRTDSNKWVIFDKGNVNVNDLVKVDIKDAKGISLRGELINEVKAA
ncbi:MAG: tRNA (N6-isopentenyl adenosine(37)-C2)-methylthiotransferase MiaB [Candidatus Marinimicrobia bacterium]|nr:tRNA (N6-isopentenyl adenosine(37)-C2)-methylthiotransferase MiaB [Candidatus Neomarinimicrobiota bacterium]|tara:strand:- start:1106 stop:2479 length:1374 start_codon:yes stop_codon:yes gene_type:complete